MKVKTALGHCYHFWTRYNKKVFVITLWEIPFDLSTVTFIATANSIEGVNEALLDGLKKYSSGDMSRKRRRKHGLPVGVSGILDADIVASGWSILPGS